MAATEQSLPALLSKLTTSLEFAGKAVPESASALPPADGISLLDVKNELFLSYLQNLAFLILVKLRTRRDNATKKDGATGSSKEDEDAVVRRLVELRIYLEKGVRPLESKLKYQIDKVVRAADDATRAAAHKPSSKSRANGSLDDDDDQEDDEEDESEAEDDEDAANELSYRPNPAALASALSSRPTASQSTNGPSTRRTPYGKSNAPTDASGTPTDGVYRPPRITATAMPNTTADRDVRDKRAKPLRSHTVDEYISAELSTAPAAEPSIGSTITHGGRRTISDKQRREDAERRDYEETNYVRLAPVGKDKKGGKRQRGLDDAASGWGGEELSLRGLGFGGDRVARVVGGKRRDGGRNEDGQRGSGFGNEVSFGGGKRRKTGRR